MAKPRLRRAEGIVIRHHDFGEADRVLTLYTPFAGKVRAIAKGVRRPASRLGGHVELFTHSQVLIASGRNLDILTQAETVNAFAHLRADLRRTSLACYVAELLDRLTPEHVENQPVFALLLETLGRLDADWNVDLAVHFFELQVLGLVGYRPQLKVCVHCNSALEAKGNSYSAPAGGVVCPRCAGDPGGARPISGNCIKVLRLLQNGDFATARRLRLDGAIRHELDATLNGHIVQVLEGELKSAGVIRSLFSSWG